MLEIAIQAQDHCSLDLEKGFETEICYMFYSN